MFIKTKNEQKIIPPMKAVYYKMDFWPLDEYRLTHKVFEMSMEESQKDVKDDKADGLE